MKELTMVLISVRIDEMTSYQFRLIFFLLFRLTTKLVTADLSLQSNILTYDIIYIYF